MREPSADHDKSKTRGRFERRLGGLKAGPSKGFSGERKAVGTGAVKREGAKVPVKPRLTL